MKGCKIDNINIQLLKELNNEPSGLRVKTLSRLTNIKGRTVYYRLEKLTEKGILFHDNPFYRIAKSIRESQEFAKLLKENKGFILSDLSFVIRLIRKPHYWENRENTLRRVFRKAEVNKVELRNNSYIQIFEYDYYIQTFNNSIIFVSTKKYAGIDPYDCFIFAVRDFIEVYNRFEEGFGFKFFEEGIPNVSVKSQNYVKLNDAIAEHCKKSGDKFEVWIDNKKVLYIDKSEPSGMESDNKDSAPDDLKVYSEYVTDMEKNNPPKLSELAGMILKVENQISVVVQNHVYYAENLKTHVGAIQSLDKTSQELKSDISLLTNKIDTFSQFVNNLQIILERALNQKS